MIDSTHGYFFDNIGVVDPPSEAIITDITELYECPEDMTFM